MGPALKKSRAFYIRGFGEMINKYFNMAVWVLCVFNCCAIQTPTIDTDKIATSKIEILAADQLVDIVDVNKNALEDAFTFCANLKKKIEKYDHENPILESKVEKLNAFIVDSYSRLNAFNLDINSKIELLILLFAHNQSSDS